MGARLQIVSFDLSFNFTNCTNICSKFFISLIRFHSAMDFLGTKLGASVLVVLLALAVATSKSIDIPEAEAFHKNQIEVSNSLAEDPPSEAELFKYLLTKELMSRHGNLFDWEERQRKRSYWKQCAFNAVSCFGKK